MIYKEEISVLMDGTEFEVIRSEIEKRHADGWVLLAQNRLHDIVFGPCVELKFQRYNKEVNPKDFIEPMGKKTNRMGLKGEIR